MSGDVLEPASPAETNNIPDKLYFRIGEVSGLIGVEPYVLRYWEAEFPAVSPKKTGGGHRLYRRKDVELLLQIKHLLYEKRYTIEGARQLLQSEPKKPANLPSEQQMLFETGLLPEIRRELAAILEMLRA
jgi:DNA-binding transcriptional MerR regulator